MNNKRFEIPNIYQDIEISDKTNESFKSFATLLSEHIQDEDEIDIYPSSWDTIIIDITNENGLVSLEVGHTQVGFFTDYNNDENLINDGENTNFETLSKSIIKAINVLHKK